jgi:hypothetical protein
MATTKDEAKKALLKLFHCFSWGGDETERKVKFAAYWEILESRQSRFVLEACEYASKGKLGDGRFLPTAAELYQLAEDFSAREARILAQSSPRLSETPCQNDHATRQRIIAGFKKLQADLRSGTPINPEKATREVFHPDDGAPLPPLSDAAKRIFGEAAE